jgi:hypothetical protein
MPFPRLFLDQLTEKIASDTEVDTKMEALANVTTSFKPYAGTAVAYVAGSWVSIFEKTVTARTQIKALTITNAGTGLTGHAYRICSPPGTPIFSEWKSDTECTFTSGVEKIMDEVIQIKKGGTFSIEVYCTATTDATATLTSIKVIELS